MSPLFFLRPSLKPMPKCGVRLASRNRDVSSMQSRPARMRTFNPMPRVQRVQNSLHVRNPCNNWLVRSDLLQCKMSDQSKYAWNICHCMLIDQQSIYHITDQTGSLDICVVPGRCPNILRLLINDLPETFSLCYDLNDIIDCLMHADDIVFFLSEKQDGLHEKGNRLQLYCSKWCRRFKWALAVKLMFTNIILIFYLYVICKTQTIKKIQNKQFTGHGLYSM